MARSFTATSSEYLEHAAAVVADYPFTMACWFQVPNVTTSYALMSLSLNTGTNQRHQLTAAGAVAGDPVQAASVDSSSTTRSAVSSAGYTADTWRLAVGVWSANNARAAYLDGGNKGTDANSVDTSGWNRTLIAARIAGGTYGGFLLGYVAHAAIWSAALTDDEVASLYNSGYGLDPRCIRPDKLAGYWPLINADGDVDWWGQFNLTPYNTPAYVDGPPLLMPSGLWLPCAVVSAVPQLVVADSECLVESESPALTQHHVLTVGGAECLVTSESPTLTQHQVLTVADSAMVVESEAPALTQHQVLSAADSVCLVVSDSPTLTQAGTLSVQDSAVLVESESPSLTQHQVLTAGGAECLVTSESPTLTHHPVGALVVQDSRCVVESDLVVLTQHQLLQVFDARIVVTSETVTLGGTYTAVVHYHAIEGPSKYLHALEGPSKYLHPLEGPSKKLKTLIGPP